MKKHLDRYRWWHYLRRHHLRKFVSVFGTSAHYECATCGRSWWVSYL